MLAATKRVIDDALRLPAIERAAIVQELLTSLDRPDAQIDALWAREAEDRISAFERGEMEAISADEVFAEFEKS